STPELFGEMIFFGSMNNAVYAVNKTTGKTRWSFLTEGPVKSPPTHHNGVIYVGSGDSRLYALDAKTGKQIWSYLTGSAIESKPYVDGWKIYVGSTDKNVYCLINSTGRPIWTLTGKGYFKYSPANYKDLIYFTSSDRKIYALDKYTGDIVWNYTLNSTIYGSPIVHTDQVIVAATNKKIYSLNPYLSKVNWQTTLNDSVYSTPFTYENTIYVSAGTNLYAIDALGEIKWSMNFSRTMKNTPSYYRGIIYSPEGYYLRAYGQTSDIKVNKIVFNPKITSPGQLTTIEIELENRGKAYASNIQTDIYLDRKNISTQTLDFHPYEIITIHQNTTTSSGTHLIEVITDSRDSMPEPDEKNNIFGATLKTTDEWSMDQKNKKRTGYLDTTDSFQKRNNIIRWSCKYSNNTIYQFNLSNLYMANYKVEETNLNPKCSFYSTRGYPISKIQSNWSCKFRNITGYTTDEFNSMMKYMHSRPPSKTEKITFPYNLSNFQIELPCDTTENPEIPVIEAKVTIDCRINYLSNMTGKTLHNLWYCSIKQISNYSLEDIAIYKGYTTHEQSPVTNGNYGVIWSKNIGSATKAPPLLVELDHSGDGNLEVLASADNTLYAIKNTGEIIWTKKLDEEITAYSLSDIEGDGTSEILASTEGGIYCIGKNGTIHWSYKIPLGVQAEAISSNGIVAFGASDGIIRGLNTKGVLQWQYQTLEAITTHPAVYDVDYDGIDELVFGSTDNTVYILYSPPYKVWMYQANGDINAAPTTAALSSRYDELIITSSDGTIQTLYETLSNTEDINRVCGPEGCVREGITKTKITSKWKYDSHAELSSSPAVADINHDGRNELAFGSQDKNLYILNSSGARILRYTTNAPIYSSPSLADLNHDQKPEIIIGTDKGTLYAINSDGKTIYQHESNQSIRSNPAVADADNDGNPEIVYTTRQASLYYIGTKTPEKPQTTTLPATELTTTTTTPPLGEPTQQAPTIAANEEIKLPLLPVFLLLSLMGYFFLTHIRHTN
ncbi:MAG: PQQ-binding-like beta-propeller repeat protein, partial [Candidatus Altiarchaeota archaeon]|nr:PQQ-binding-like beta-propeller repeat protein [Candidatus Altiarchaeota archaeon]